MELQELFVEKLNKTNENYYFPVFYYKFDNNQFYFKEICLEIGKINFVIGNKKSGKSLFLKSMCGLESPIEKSLNKSFLNYDIVYKPENIKLSKNYALMLLKDYLILKNINNNKLFDFNDYLNTKLKDIPEEQKQILGFLLSLNTEGLIYIIDLELCNISNNNRKKMWDIIRIFCEKNNKIGIIVEETDQFKMSNDSIYKIEKFNDNDYYGQQLF
jgi:translation initiation factor RLI1